MELAFETPYLRRICESDVEARARYPDATVNELQARLADVHAAKSASDLVVSRALLDPSPPARVQFRLDGGYELVCVGNHPSPPLTTGGLIDLDRMRRVKVVKFGREREND